MTSLRNAPWLLGICVCACLTPLASVVHAAPDPVAEAEALLASGDRDQVEAGLQGLGMLGTAAAVPPIVARVRQGLPPELLETAILTLMALGQSHAAPVLFELTSHRRPEIRVQAIEAIVAIGPKGAEDVLRRALSDVDPKVRAAAAVALGDINASESVERLFLALDRGNLKASVSIGKILKPEEVDRLVAYLGKIPFRSLSPALTEVLKRKDVPERTKLGIVGRLQETGTPEMKTYLSDFLRTESASISPALSKALLRAIQEIAN